MHLVKRARWKYWQVHPTKISCGQILTDGLKASFEMNRLNAPLLGIDAVKIFEIGTVFKKDKEEIST
jgi:hypothetical protein